MRHEFLDEYSLRIRDFAEPLLDDHAVLVAVEYVFIPSHAQMLSLLDHYKQCPSDGLPQRVKQVLERASNELQDKRQIEFAPWNSIYSFSGRVVATGSKVTTLRAGDSVACVSSSNHYHADLMCISEYDAVLLTDKQHNIRGSVVGFVLLGMHAIQRASIQIGHYVCISGFNAFSYVLMQLAKLSGATVLVLDDDEHRLSRAQIYGASATFNTKENVWDREIAILTQQHGVDVTIINNAGLEGITSQKMIGITRSHGRIVLVGVDDIHVDNAILGKKDIDLAVAAPFDTCQSEDIYKQNDSIIPFIKWRQRHTMQKVVRLIEHGELRIDPLVESCFEFDFLTSNMQHHLVHSDTGMVVSVNFTKQKSSHTIQDEFKPWIKETKRGKDRFFPAIRDAVRVGVVGADMFVQKTLMPLLARIGDVTVSAVADPEFTSAEKVSHLFGVAKASTLDSDLVESESVDALVIASNGRFHADRVLYAMQHHKAVFVKEPLVTSFEQLDLLRGTMQTHAEVPLCVDYHRSFSPFVNKIKACLQKRSTPLMLRYRVNIRHPLPGVTNLLGMTTGRIVSEACHYVDLFCYLTDAQPVAISVESIRAGRDDVFPTDNFSAQISFDDGSVCALTYTSLGHEQFGREHMEIYFDSKVIVMQDYLTLTGYGLPFRFDEVVSTPDYGREHLVNQFFTGIRENPVVVPMSKERIMRVAHTTLMIDKLACSGGGNTILS